MSQAGNIAQYVTIGLSRQTEAYSYWYENEMAKNTTKIKQALVSREKALAKRGVEMQKQNAAMVSGEAANAQKEADYTRRVGDIKEDQYRDETDAGLSSAYANMANSGVDMSYGSPMEYMSAAIDKRAEGLGLLEWQNDYNNWQAESNVAALKNKSAIMLDAAKIAEANLVMYDYQNQLYDYAQEEADKAAMMKQGQAYLGAFTDSLSVFSGSGGSGGGGGMSGMMNMNSGAGASAAG